MQSSAVMTEWHNCSLRWILNGSPKAFQLMCSEHLHPVNSLRGELEKHHKLLGSQSTRVTEMETSRGNQYTGAFSQSPPVRRVLVPHSSGRRNVSLQRSKNDATGFVRLIQTELKGASFVFGWNLSAQKTQTDPMWWLQNHLGKLIH